ncbi:UNKNOWN [Stylonychia lemnae]|uniref:Transmembrane protein n=1 Tax=Stylonychia lemnae TaxID=5949 RepID=A0A078AYK8_STYLE|nr:UNKNOWN [Stylonychia lemnae]|eukprot:CDW87216.1 UNKNOWN [Stylonychia lemnae]
MKAPKVKEESDDDSYSTIIKNILYFSFGSALYFYLCSPIAHFVSKHFTTINTGVNFIDNIYYRYYVHTKFLPLQQWAYYSIMLATGFMFINLVNLKNIRGNPFLGFNNSYYHFKYTIFLSFALFLTSGIVVFRQSHDLASYCEHNSQIDPFIVNPVDPKQTDIDVHAPLFKIFMTIEKMNYTRPYSILDKPDCYIYSDDEVFDYNYHIWTFAFLLGLQFTHLQVGFMKNFSLSWDIMKTWPLILWLVFFSFIGFMIYIFTYLFYLYAQINLLYNYVGCIGIIVGGIWLRGKQLGPKAVLHIHHYFIGIVSCMLICYQNTFFTVLHALFSGVMIEGGCRWGFVGIWSLPQENSINTENAKVILTSLAQSKARHENHKLLAAKNQLPIVQATPQSNMVDEQRVGLIQDSSSNQSFSYEYEDIKDSNQLA